MRVLQKVTLLLILALVSSASFAKASDYTVEDFFKNPEFSGMQLSPDGKHIAVISPVNGRRNLVFLETDNLTKTVALTGYDKSDVAGYFWANNETIVFTMDNSSGMEAFGLYKVKITGKRKIDTLVGSTAGKSGVVSASTVNTLYDDPDHIIIQFNGRRVKSPDLFKLPINSHWNHKKKRNKKMKMIAKNPGNVQGWLVDNDGDVRGASTLDGMKGAFLYKEKGEKEFRTIKEFNVLDEGMSPLGFDFDNKTLYVSSNIGRDKAAIYTYDPVTDTMGDMIFGHDVVDVGGLIMSRKRQKLLGATYFDDYPHSVYFDEDEKSLMEGIKSAFPGKEVNIGSMSRDENLNILIAHSDTDPGTYYLLNRKTGKVRFLLQPMSWIKSEDMSPMKPIKFTSRDGMTIRGYLTLPKGSEGKKVPLIMNPHGGPFGVRDSWGYNPEHQFFASRGYATVQVNYRGSGGYGRSFEHAGYGGKWGAEMQHDLTDAVKYLIDEGIVDSEKVCIYGASYGGYATMAGLTFTPELYKCGVNYVGVTDIALLFTSMPKTWEPAKELMKHQIGDPEDKALMDRMSPLAHVDKIQAPLMIVQGARDPRVVKQHATDLRKALSKRGINLTDDEWIMKPKEGHGFRKEENKFELYHKMEKFFAKYLN